MQRNIKANILFSKKDIFFYYDKNFMAVHTVLIKQISL